MIIKNLSFMFDREKKNCFFKDLRVNFEPHQVHFMQGDNGVGKSTLFSILQGTTPYNAVLEVTVELDGVTYCAQENALPQEFTQQVHVVVQQYDQMLACEYSFLENLQLANLPRYPGLCSLPTLTLLDMIKVWGIDLTAPVYKLSGGQRQLLALCMALQKQTKLLLLDEPTATLDHKNAHLVMDCLHMIAQQLSVTIVVICHDKELVARYAQQGYWVMRQSKEGVRVLEKDLFDRGARGK